MLPGGRCRWRALPVALVAAGALTPAASALGASSGAGGVRGQSVGPVADPTASKPESKLWFAGGFWWADMIEPFSGAHHIFRLDRATQTWEDSGVEVDPGLTRAPTRCGTRRQAGCTSPRTSSPKIRASARRARRISSAIAFGGDKLGVMWSNQNDGKFHYAVHPDGAGDAADAWNSTAIGGMPLADNHINLKADAAGRVYVAVKHTEETSIDPLTLAVIHDPGAPLISLMVRSPEGSWRRATVTEAGDHGTRPIVVLEEQRGLIHVFHTSDTTGGSIEEKVSPIAAPAFKSAGTVMKGSSINNVTSTKQNVGAASGLTLLASDASTY